MPIVARIVPNMCPPFEEHTSIDRLGRMPTSSSRPVAGQPCPICSSISGEHDALQPQSAIIFSSSSASELQCTKVMVGSEHALLRKGGDWAVLSPLAVADMAADPQLEFLSQRPVALGDVQGRELIAARRRGIASPAGRRWRTDVRAGGARRPAG